MKTKVLFHHLSFVVCSGWQHKVLKGSRKTFETRKKSLNNTLCWFFLFLLYWNGNILWVTKYTATINESSNKSVHDRKLRRFLPWISFEVRFPEPKEPWRCNDRMSRSRTLVVHSPRNGTSSTPFLPSWGSERVSCSLSRPWSWVVQTRGRWRGTLKIWTTLAIVRYLL